MDKETSIKDRIIAWIGVAVITAGFGFFAYATLFFQMGWWLK